MASARDRFRHDDFTPRKGATMGRLFQLVDAHRDAQAPYTPSYARIAEQVGVSRQTLLNWRTPKELIQKEHLVKLAAVTGVPYQRVLDALLEDIGYLREEEPAKKPAKKKAPLSPTEREIQETVGDLAQRADRAAKAAAAAKRRDEIAEAEDA